MACFTLPLHAGLFSSAPLTAGHALGWSATYMSVHTTNGWLVITSNLLTALVGALYLVWIVERAKKCLDFASTVYFWHFVATCIYSGFPARLEWWVVNGCSLAIMALLGEYLCVRRELMDIPLSALRSLRGAGSSSSSSSSSRATAGGSGATSKEQGTDEERAPLTSVVVEMSSLPGSGGGQDSRGGQVTPTLRTSAQGGNSKAEFK
jgi:hypothetical protein